jgi:hypothetical protein
LNCLTARDDLAAIPRAQLLLEKTLADQTGLRPIDGEDLTDRAVALLDHRAPLIVAAALMLLTGRRKIEILRTGHLSAVPAGAKISENAPPEHTLVFDGQAKTRGAVSAQTAPYPIPVLAEPQLVLDAFVRLRDSYDCANLTNEQVHNRTSKTLNGYVAQFFSDDAGNAMMPKDLRAAYATIAWEWFAPPHIAQSAYFARASSDTPNSTYHGPTLVERSLGYLTVAQYGQTEDEVLDVLAQDDAVWSDFEKHKHHEVSERRLPVVVWSRLSLDLEPYLTERAAPGGTVIAFYHRQLAECAERRFLAGAESQARHGDLAHFFFARPVHDLRRLVELSFQQRGARQWAQAEETLFDCRFLFAKCGAGMVLDLEADYQARCSKRPRTRSCLAARRSARFAARCFCLQISSSATQGSSLLS